MELFYGSLIGLGILAAILSIINIVRLTEIHRLVNRNFSEQRTEIASLHSQLDIASAAATRAEQSLRDVLQHSPRAPKSEEK